MEPGALVLALREGLAPRLDRPAVISLSDGLTIGRGDAHILLDSAAFPALISRVHATVRLDAALGATLENHSINQTALEGRCGAGLKPEKALRPGKRALLTEGCTVVFGSRGSRDEFAYVVRRTGAPAAAAEPVGPAAAAAAATGRR